MSNRTVSDAHSIHGRDPQRLVEKIVRDRIQASRYWKEECFGLDTVNVVEKAAALRYFGGTYGGHAKSTPFLCLLLKLLQLQPEPEIVMEMIRNPDFKYIKMLGCLYWRLTQPAAAVYTMLEPEYADYRPVVYRTLAGKFQEAFLDEFVDDLLQKDRVCNIILPQLARRQVLEERSDLPPREPLISSELSELSGLDDDDNDDDDDVNGGDHNDTGSGLALSFKRPAPVSVGPEQDIEPIEPGPKSKRSDGSGVSLSIEETNKLRIKLGLKPLKL